MALSCLLQWVLLKMTFHLGGEFGGDWIHVHVWLSPFTLHLKLSQHCLLIGCVGMLSLQSCLTLCDPVGCSLPGASVHRSLQAK